MNKLTRAIVQRYITLISILIGMSGLVWAIRVQLPPSQGQEDVAITGPATITGQESQIYDFIGIINQYLRFTIVVISFAALLYAGFKLMSNIGKSRTEGREATINVIKGAGLGIMLSIFSYVIIRLIVTLL